MSTRKYGRCTLRSNVNLNDILGNVADMPRKITGSVSNPKEYAIYTELGTSKMKPHAMVRGSLPAIEKKSEQVLGSLSLGASESQILAAANEIIDFAYDVIVEATHRSKINTPEYIHMQDAWEKGEVESNG